MFKECADIKTADTLNLPTPEVEFINVVAEPTEHQKEMIKELSERAKLVRDRRVDSTEDNMLRITGDGRKIGLDQRLMNPLLPDEENTKVNMCVNNIFGRFLRHTFQRYYLFFLQRINIGNVFY